MLDIFVYLRVLKGDQRAVAERVTASLSTALTCVSTKDVLCCAASCRYLRFPSHLLCLLD